MHQESKYSTSSLNILAGFLQRGETKGSGTNFTTDWSVKQELSLCSLSPVLPRNNAEQNIIPQPECVAPSAEHLCEACLWFAHSPSFLSWL